MQEDATPAKARRAGGRVYTAPFPVCAGRMYRGLGKIDREVYSCVAGDIVTDEVIITDERVQHIKERHPGGL